MNELVVISAIDLKLLLRELMRQELATAVSAFIPEEVLTSEDVLKMLKISKGHLITLRKIGLPHYYLGLGSGAIRYRRSEVLQYMGILKK